MSVPSGEPQTCPACGGAGGGPFGRARGAWDTEDYLCPRCEGLGVVRVAIDDVERIATGPSLVKAKPDRTAEPKKKRAQGN